MRVCRPGLDWARSPWPRVGCLRWAPSVRAGGPTAVRSQGVDSSSSAESPLGEALKNPLLKDLSL